MMMMTMILQSRWMIHDEDDATIKKLERERKRERENADADDDNDATIKK